MSVVITTYTLASGLMQQGMTWWQALITILLGNAIVLVPDDPERPRRHEVRRVVPGAVPRELRRHGRERPGDAARDCRVRLVRHPDVDRRAGARHVDARRLARLVRGARRPCGSRSPRSGRSRSRIILRGLEGIKLLESWSAPLLLGGGLALLLWAIDAGGGLSRILGESSRVQQARTPFWTLFPAALTANVGYWATLSLNIPDFTRYAQQPALAGARARRWDCRRR